MGESIPASAWPSHGSDSRIADATAHRPDGRTVSKEATRELGNVSLSSDSVTVMEDVSGPDSEKSAQPVESATQVSPGGLATTLDVKAEKINVDWLTVMTLMYEITQQEYAVVTADSNAKFTAEIAAMESANEDALQARWVTAITGMVVGAFGAVAGGVSIGGAAKGLSTISAAQKARTDGIQNASALATEQAKEAAVTTANKTFDAGLASAGNFSQITQSVGQAGQSLGQVGSGIGEGVSAGFDKASKDADIEAKANERQVELDRNMIASIGDMLAAVRQTLRDVQSAQNEADRAAMRV
jgi:hypothetical protein